MMARYFEGFSAFGRFLLEREIAIIPSIRMVTYEAAKILYERAYKIYGDVSKLKPLAQATQDDRVSQGFSPNNPLLRDGSTLQSGLEHDSAVAAEIGLAGIGSSNPIHKFHEFGYLNVRTGDRVPARSVLRKAMSEAAAVEIPELVNGCISFMLAETRRPRLKAPSSVTDIAL